MDKGVREGGEKGWGGGMERRDGEEEWRGGMERRRKGSGRERREEIRQGEKGGNKGGREGREVEKGGRE